MEVQNDIGALDLRLGRFPHPLLEQVRGIEQPGEIVEDHLGRTLGPEPHDRKAGGLCLRAHDGQVLAHEHVQQRALADVGSAGERDVAAPRPRGGLLRKRLSHQRGRAAGAPIPGKLYSMVAPDSGSMARMILGVHLGAHDEEAVLGPIDADPGTVDLPG